MWLPLSIRTSLINDGYEKDVVWGERNSCELENFLDVRVAKPLTDRGMLRTPHNALTMKFLG